MSTKASLASGYRFRLILMTLLMLGFGAYCIYDATVAYPLSRDIGAAYEQVKADHPETYPQVWPAEAERLGYPTDVPKKAKTDTDILTQWVMAAIVLPVGLFFGFKLLKENGRWVAMDEQGLTASGGHAVAWDGVTGLEDERWKTKGIAHVVYGGDGGTERRILLDDFKLEREATKAIYERTLAQVRPGVTAKVEASPAPAAAESRGDGDGAADAVV